MKPDTEYANALLQAIEKYIQYRRKTADFERDPHNRRNDIRELRKLILTAVGYTSERITEVFRSTYFGPDMLRLNEDYLTKEPIDNIALKIEIEKHLSEMKKGPFFSHLKSYVGAVNAEARFSDRCLHALYVTEDHKYRVGLVSEFSEDRRKLQADYFGHKKKITEPVAQLHTNLTQLFHLMDTNVLASDKNKFNQIQTEITEKRTMLSELIGKLLSILNIGRTLPPVPQKTAAPPSKAAFFNPWQTMDTAKDAKQAKKTEEIQPPRPPAPTPAH